MSGDREAEYIVTNRDVCLLHVSPYPWYVTNVQISVF
jgi:hypothetical protein